METRADLDRAAGDERSAVGDDNDLIVRERFHHAAENHGRRAGRLHRTDHELAQQELDRVQVLHALDVVRIELRRQRVDRLGDALQRGGQRDRGRGWQQERLRFGGERWRNLVVDLRVDRSPPRRLGGDRFAVAPGDTVDRLAQREHSFEAGPFGQAADPHAVHRRRP